MLLGLRHRIGITHVRHLTGLTILKVVFWAVSPFGEKMHSRLQYNGCSASPCDDFLLVKMFLSVYVQGD